MGGKGSTHAHTYKQLHTITNNFQLFKNIFLKALQKAKTSKKIVKVIF